MTSLNPDHLLQQAVRLTIPPQTGRVRQIDIRRAISAAYYGVFHATLTAAADTVVGRVHRRTARYVTVYRSVEHKDLKAICDIVRRPALPEHYRSHVPPGGFLPAMKSFAFTVAWLQERRNAADYDPGSSFGMDDATVAIEEARSAIDTWRSQPAEQRDALVWLLLFRPRP